MFPLDPKGSRAHTEDTFPALLKALRLKKRLTQEELAREIGCTLSLIHI